MGDPGNVQLKAWHVSSLDLVMSHKMIDERKKIKDQSTIVGDGLHQGFLFFNFVT